MKPLDCAHLVKAMTSELRRRAVGDDLSRMLRKVRHQAAGAPLELGSDAEVRRFLHRLGVLRSPGASASASKAAAELVERCARESGEDPTTVSVKMRLFASGAYGVVPEASCGDSPRCGECALAEMCLSASSGEAPLPDGERPAERLAEQGPDALATGELLSVVLRSRGRDAEALALARKLLAGAGSLRALAGMSAAELEAAGVRPAEAAVRLKGALALAERTAAEPREPGERLSSGDEVFKRCRARLRDLKKERFLAIYLDQKNRVIAEERISEGSLTASPVNPREVFGPALRLAAAGVIFVHNHPSGDATPSKEDVSLTRSLLEAGRLLGLRVLDHVVMGENDFTSMLDAGLMEEEVPRA